MSTTLLIVVFKNLTTQQISFHHKHIHKILMLSNNTLKTTFTVKNFEYYFHIEDRRPPIFFFILLSNKMDSVIKKPLSDCQQNNQYYQGFRGRGTNIIIGG